MQTKDFAAFCQLLTDLHVKIFGEPLDKLSHSKAQMLSWLIFDVTGELLSYKSLANYFLAAVQQNATQVNPNLTTLTILIEFTTETSCGEQPDLVFWLNYRNRVLCNKQVIVGANQG